MFVSRTRPTVRKRCDSEYFLCDLRRLFCFDYRKSWLEFRYCSRIYVRNWFTLLNEQNPLLDFEGTRFVNDLWKITKKTYLPTHRWNGGSGAGSEHIFKGGLAGPNVWQKNLSASLWTVDTNSCHADKFDDLLPIKFISQWS